MIRRIVAALAVLVVSLSFAGLALAASWHVVKSKRVSGEFAVTAVSATISHPRALAIKLIGSGVSNGEAVVACSRGFSTSAHSASYNGPGFYRLRIMRHASSCQVTASVGGSGTLRVKILKYS